MSCVDVSWNYHAINRVFLFFVISMYSRRLGVRRRRAGSSGSALSEMHMPASGRPLRDQAMHEEAGLQGDTQDEQVLPRVSMR